MSAAPVALEVSSARQRAWIPSLAAFALSLVLALASVRGAADTLPSDPDAFRHAMNGVLIHDLVRDGAMHSPITYTQRYFARYPAVSMPYHPPGFPAFTAVLYRLFGISHLTARAAVAVSVFAVFWLLFLLARALFDSAFLALFASSSLLLLPTVQRVSTDVMLEMPSLALGIGALLVWHTGWRQGKPHRLWWFGAIAALAVWTKQNAVFLILVPPMAILLSRRWDALRSFAFWTGVAIATAGSVALALVMRLGQATGNPEWQPTSLWDRVSHHALAYFVAASRDFTAPVLLLAFASSALLLLRAATRPLPQQEALIGAWLVSAAALPLALPPWDVRYLIYLYPALIFAVCAILARRTRQSSPVRFALAVAASAAVLLQFFSMPVVGSTGMGEAAAFVSDQRPSRILLCSRRNGGFVFAYRIRNDRPSAYILRAESYPADFFEPRRFADFLTSYAIEYVVIHYAALGDPHESISSNAVPQLTLERTYSAAGTPPVNGTIGVFRNRQLSPQPHNTFSHSGRLSGFRLDLP